MVSFQIFGPDPAFQLPLSGSQTAKTTTQTPLAYIVAFNSLSRDHWPGLDPTLNDASSFNSLSRDHRARFRDFPALRGFLPRHLFA